MAVCSQIQVLQLVAPTRDISGIKNWRPILWKTPSHREHCWLWLLCLLCLFLLLSMSVFLLLFFLLIVLLVDWSSCWLIFYLIDLLVDWSSCWLIFLLIVLLVDWPSCCPSSCCCHCCCSCCCCWWCWWCWCCYGIPHSRRFNLTCQPFQRKVGLQPSPYQMSATKPSGPMDVWESSHPCLDDHLFRAVVWAMIIETCCSEISHKSLTLKTQSWIVHFPSDGLMQCNSSNSWSFMVVSHSNKTASESNPFHARCSTFQ